MDFTLQIKRAALLTLCLTAIGCRGNKSSSPPIHFQLNMDHQKKFEPQEANAFFRDNRGMRLPVPGTIALGELKSSDAFYRGKRGGQWTTKLPVKLTSTLMARGQERFNIYCAVCHGEAGDGKSAVADRGIAVKPTSYHDERLLQEPIGHFFNVISNGIRNMPGFAAQIPVRDRWAIAAYVRALQISGSATIAQVPADVAKKEGWK